MGLIVEKGGERVQREIPKKGLRLAVLVGLIDVGVQVREFNGEKKRPCREVLPMFHLLNDKYTDDDGNEHCMNCSPFFPLGIMPGSDKSKYMKLCNALDPNGEIVPDGAGDMTQLLGKPCFVKVKHNEREGINYGNFDGVSELPEDYPVPEHDCPNIFFDTENPSKEIWDTLWDRTKDVIRGMIDYDKSKCKVVCDEDNTGAAQESNKEDRGEAKGSEGEADDDIPF